MPDHVLIVAVYINADGTDLDTLLTEIENCENVRAAIDLDTVNGFDARPLTIQIPNITDVEQDLGR
jgi:hypothetical protein